MRVRRNPNFVAGALLAVAAGLALLGPALAPAKKGKSKLRSPGKLVVATQGYTLDKVDDRTRMTVGMSRGQGTLRRWLPHQPGPGR